MKIIGRQEYKKGLTIGELLVASSIAIIVVGGAFALWFMTQDTWTNERTKSDILQKLQVAIERIKREIKISDGGKIFFHVTDGTYDAISFPIALDDGRSNTGYNAAEEGDGFIETDSSTTDPITGVAKIYWDETAIYYTYYNAGTKKYELRRTSFYPRDNSLTAAQRQDQINKVVSLGTGNDLSVPNYLNCQNKPDGYRSIITTSAISFEVAPKLREFDAFSSTTERTEKLIDFGSAILNGGYHTIKFKVIGKNINSTGYSFGIDSLKFTPPGSEREAENYVNLTHPDGTSGISSSSGDATTIVNMHESPLGLWDADYYMDYAADQIDNDYLTLRFHYDRWYETTFLDGISNNVIVEFGNTDGRGGTSGSEEWLVRLEGNGKTWDSATQTKTSAPATLAWGLGGGDTTYRTLVMSNYTVSNGMKLSIKLRAGNSDPLIVQSAHIIQRDDSGLGSADDGSSNMPNIPITFNNCHLDPRNQGQAALPATTTGNDVTIPAGCYVWSNWIQLYDNIGANFNFEKTQDYFISFYTPLAAAPASMSYWQDITSSPKTHSYTRVGKWDDVRIWGGGGTADVSIYGIEEVDVTYVNTGTFISQIFDTGVEDPSYGTMKWSSVINSPDSTLQIRVRSSDSKPALEGDGDWSAIPGQVFTSSPVLLSGIGTGRYVQFKADFTALASGVDASHISNDTDDTYGGDEDYDISCVLKDVSIYWPGNTTMVDVGGHFTKKINYGIFTVEIDGQKLTKGFVIDLSITEDLTTGASISRSITAEVEPRNTNK